MKSSVSVRLVLSLFLLAAFGLATTGRMTWPTKTGDVAAAGAPLIPVSYSPQSVCLGGLLPGERRSGSVTIGSAPTPVVVTASVVDDTSQGQFRNLQVIAYDVERDSKGRPLDITEVGRSDGVTPLPVARGQMVEIEVDFVAPSAPQTDTFTATLLISGDGFRPQFNWQAIRVPLAAHIGKVKTTLLQSAVTIRQGEEGDLPFLVETIDVPITVWKYVSYALADTELSRGITLSPTSISVQGGSVARGNFHFKVGNDVPVGNHELSIYQYASGCQPDIVLEQHPIVNVIPGQVGDYTGLRWEQANPNAIQIDVGQTAWHAGHVNDVLALGADGLVVATDTGGAWLVTGNGDARPLGNNWDNPDLSCLALGPDDPRHVFAGGGALYESNAVASDPLASWRAIPLPPGARWVNRIEVLGATRRIVLACDNGVWWSPIPLPITGGGYRWRAAQGLPAGNYSGLAAGPDNTIIAAAYGVNLQTGLYGIFRGEWTVETGDLMMSRATITGADERQMFRTSLAACAGVRNFMYAVSSDGAGDSYVYTALRSGDGGRSWVACGQTIEGAPNGYSFKAVFGHMGWYNNCIAVSPTDPRLVTIGWNKSFFISQNAGDSWRAAGLYWPNPQEPDKPEFNNPHTHEDVHAVYFDPYDSAGQRLYVGSDGGLVVTPDLGQTFRSDFNRQLLNLQFYDRKLSVSPDPRSVGLLGGATQDNGNLYCVAGQTPWKQHVSGDGGLMLLLANGGLLSYYNTDPLLRVSLWNGAGFDYAGLVTYGSLGAEADIKEPPVERVPAPVERSVSNEPMWAVGAWNSFVFGVFSSGNGPGMHYEFLGGIPTVTPISAVGSIDGRNIFVGTRDGRIFLVVAHGSVRQLPGVPLQNLNGDPNTSIDRIVVVNNSLAFALFNSPSHHYILRWDGQQWAAVNIATRLPETDTFTALEATPQAIFAATDNRVYVSFDCGGGCSGNYWLTARVGLPERPHCRDLRFMAQPDGQYLYLSTYGRSVWRARLN